MENARQLLSKIAGQEVRQMLWVYQDGTLQLEFSLEGNKDGLVSLDRRNTVSFWAEALLGLHAIKFTYYLEGEEVVWLIQKIQNIAIVERHGKRIPTIVLKAVLVIDGTPSGFIGEDNPGRRGSLQCFCIHQTPAGTNQEVHTLR